MTIKTSISATLYSPIYVMKVVISLKVKMCSLKVLIEKELEESEWAKSCYRQLNMIN